MSIAINKITPLLLLLLLSAACGNVKKPANHDYAVPLMIGNKKIYVEIADTKEKMAQGLSGREKLQNDQGMLFDFRNDYPDGTSPGFWMKAMKFDLDLIWIHNGKIIDITENAPAPKSANDKLPLYYPKANIDMVLEVNAGWSGENGVEVGDVVQLK